MYWRCIGRVVGLSDAKDAYPKDNPITPQDVLATLDDHLGIDTDRHYLDHFGRPIKTLPSGRKLTELM